MHLDIIAAVFAPFILLFGVVTWTIWRDIRKYDK